MPNAMSEATIEERPASVAAEPRVQDQLRDALEQELAAVAADDTGADTDGAFMFTDT